MKKSNLKNIQLSGFEVPKTYFDDLDNDLLNGIREHTIRNKITDHGFSVPDNYFNSLESHIATQLSNNTTNNPVIFLFENKMVRYAIGIAAALIVLVAVAVSNSRPTFDKLANQTVENYMLQEDFSTYEIAALLTEEELEESISIQLDLIEDNIEEYLINNVDVEDLILE